MAEKHPRQKTLPLVSYWFIFKKIHQNIILNPTVNPCHDIAETLLKLALNTNQSINPNEPQKGLYDMFKIFTENEHLFKFFCENNIYYM
jgi:hypothetical protein